MAVVLLGVAGGVKGDEENEMTALVAGAVESKTGILHGFFILSVFCHLLHCHDAGCGQRLQGVSGPCLLGGALASGVPGFGIRRAA